MVNWSIHQYINWSIDIIAILEWRSFSLYFIQKSSLSNKNWLNESYLKAKIADFPYLTCWRGGFFGSSRVSVYIQLSLHWTRILIFYFSPVISCLSHFIAYLSLFICYLSHFIAYLTGFIYYLSLFIPYLTLFSC